MPKLQFEPRPVEPWWHRDEDCRREHEDYVRRVYERHHPGETPSACDCGYYTPGALVTCHGRLREECHAKVGARLQAHHRRAHDDALKKKREFPDVLNRGPGCNWCGQPIVYGRVRQRGWHDGREDEPDCLLDYYRHTRLENQQTLLLGRDGLGCRQCGAIAGTWSHMVVQPRWIEGWKREKPERYQAYTGDEYWRIDWNTAHEVDHLIALAVAWEAYADEPQRHRWFFGPGNLRLLCSACHKAKTRADLAMLAQVRGDRAGARAAVLEVLAAHGLVRLTPPAE